MTREQIKADLFEAVNAGDERGASAAFGKLVFFGTGSSELRGVSDSGLTDAELAQVVGALSLSIWFESIFNRLAA